MKSNMLPAKLIPFLLLLSCLSSSYAQPNQPSPEETLLSTQSINGYDAPNEIVLTGSLTDINQFPISQWNVSVYATDGTNIANIFTDEDSYTIPLTAGDFIVTPYFFHNYYSPSWGYTGYRLPYTTISIFDTTNYNLSTSPITSYQLSGVVADTQGHVQPDVLINILDKSGRFWGHTSTDSSGNYGLLLPAGSYYMHVTPSSVYPRFTIANILLSSDKVRNIKVGADFTLLNNTLHLLPDHLDVTLEIFDIIDAAESKTYDIQVQGDRLSMQVIANWAGSEMSMELYDPNGIIHAAHQSTEPPIVIDIPNPAEGTWTCSVNAIEVPSNNFPIALVSGVPSNIAPTADLHGPYSGDICDSIIVDGSNSKDVDGEIYVYEWDWNNDGDYDESTYSSTAKHTWKQVYHGNIGLKVTDNNGASDTALAEIAIDEDGPDWDNDGVSDCNDRCLETGDNLVVDQFGCSIHDLVPCDSDWANHGQYVSNIAKTLGQFYDMGLISHGEKNLLVSEAAQSSCGFQ